MSYWRDFVACEFFAPCSRHPHHVKRHFCLDRRVPYCAECFPTKANGVKVYKNCYCDVIRAPAKNFADIQTFRCNGELVLYLRPFKNPKTADKYATVCVCGRGVSGGGKYCSVQCLVHKPHALVHKPHALVHKLSSGPAVHHLSKPRKIERKSPPVRSPLN